jgi:hypothetical protein
MRELAVDMPLCQYWCNQPSYRSKLGVTWWYGMILPLWLRKACSLLGYILNKLWTSQGGESPRWWAWCSFLINIEGLILVTWSMLGCHLTNFKINIFLSIIFSSCRLYPHCICQLLARAHVPRPEWTHSLYNATCLVIKPSVQLKMLRKLIFLYLKKKCYTVFAPISWYPIGSESCLIAATPVRTRERRRWRAVHPPKPNEAALLLDTIPT